MDWFIIFLLFFVLLGMYAFRKEMKKEIGKIQNTLSSIKADMQK